MNSSTSSEDPHSLIWTLAFVAVGICADCVVGFEDRQKERGSVKGEEHCVLKWYWPVKVGFFEELYTQEQFPCSSSLCNTTVCVACTYRPDRSTPNSQLPTKSSFCFFAFLSLSLYRHLHSGICYAEMKPWYFSTYTVAVPHNSCSLLSCSWGSELNVQI